jgi:hypothetical protein
MLERPSPYAAARGPRFPLPDFFGVFASGPPFIAERAVRPSPPLRSKGVCLEKQNARSDWGDFPVKAPFAKEGFPNS